MLYAQNPAYSVWSKKAKSFKLFKVSSSQVKLSFIVIPLHVGTYSGMKCRTSQDHSAT